MSLRVSVVAACRANEKHIRHARLFGRLGQLRSDVELFAVRRRDKTDGIAARVFKRLGQVNDAPWAVGDDGGPKVPEFTDVGRFGVQGQAGHGVDLGGECGVAEEELSNEEARLAVNGCDTDVAWHSAGWMLYRPWS